MCVGAPATKSYARESNIEDKNFNNYKLMTEDDQRKTSPPAEAVASSTHSLKPFNNSTPTSTDSSPSRKRKVDSCSSTSTLPSAATQPSRRQQHTPTDLGFPRDKNPDMHAKRVTTDFEMQPASLALEDPGRNVLPHHAPDIDYPSSIGCMDLLLWWTW